MYEYKAKVTRVIDGDTFEALVDLGFYIFTEITLRLVEVNTPETWRPINEAENYHGELATKFVSDLILDKEIIIKTTGQGIYNRWNSKVYVDDKNIGDLIESHNLVRLEDSYYKDLEEDDYKEKIDEHVKL